MIQIEKPETPPARLATKGAKRIARDCASYDEGSREFTFASGLYGHASVKRALIVAQHGKCCFCERLTGNDGDVEHYRPKASSKQASGEERLTPGYYWLAYDWSNLFLSCGPCNSRQKGTLFPLEDPAVRARSHHDDLAQEAPLFVKPDKEDPEQHIGFRAEVAFGRTARGQTTIDELSLNRDVLCEERLQRLQELKTLRGVIAVAPQHPENARLQALAERARRRIEKALSISGEYAAANRCAEADNFENVLPAAA